MSDQADVEIAMTQLIASALYPATAGGHSAIGTTVRVYRGWPNAPALDADLAAGRVNVTVFPVPGAMRITTRYPVVPQTTRATPQLSATSSGNTATFAGVANPGQVAGVLVEGRPYVYRTAPHDTPALVAAILTTAIAAKRPATLAGATITTPGAIPTARVVADGSSSTELRRQIQPFRITTWCPTPNLRDAACAILDPILAGTPFLTLGDGTPARLTFVSTTTLDQRQDAALYRRDLLYDVEYPTTISAIQPSMLFGTVGLGADIITA